MCKHQNSTATCCQCEQFRAFELKHRMERERRIAALLAGRPGR